MKKHYSAYSRLALVGALSASIAACTTQSGPTYTAHAIVAPNQAAPTYRVSCRGLLESSQTCFKVAAEICKDKTVTPLESVDGVKSGVNTNNPRELTFMCGQPAEVPQAVAPRPPAQLSAPLQTRARGQVLLQGNANFAKDSAVLSDVVNADLDQFVRANQGASFRSITVTGHTDSSGSLIHNRQLSQARAQSVLRYLRSHGMRAEQFIAEGEGADNPVASNATAEGRALNRRVEVHVVAM
ncbi:OmpA family protein [Paraburkholderia sp. MMS20-SJTR3]|uniref:OmpA family protein n=1 Tax=Paraburkholderia sejongensis TaxID=2886946 RepID=A0ABS8K5Z1_9BURK|nr:OmpA family protein [Paraburkholderia sp. MMS20-SJTR3]MCC8397572.1 OmpA family protein [Paraburkholderia sp. MMS20-SJTR3]